MSVNKGWSERMRDVAERFRDAAVSDGETFHRTSWTVRVEVDATGGRAAHAEGLEQGGSVRRKLDGDGGESFAAASGDPRAAVGGSLARLVPAAAGRGWNDAADGCEDLDAGPGLPEPGEIEDWLRGTLEGLVEVGSAWTEVALTLECWSNGRATQTRGRVRGWAGWSPREVGRMPARPLLAAARGWQDLKRFDPSPRWLEREVRRGRDIPWPRDAPVAFSAETAALLVHRLAIVLHGPAGEIGRPVGPGWRLDERPLDRTALLGALRDDCGHPCENRSLADGRRVTGVWVGPGFRRRGSFRDLPEDVPCCLELRPPAVELPESAVRVTEAGIHPAGPGEWLLRLVGRSSRGTALRPVWLRTRPERLAREVLGGYGDPFTGIRGVRTPALLFDTAGWVVDQG